MTKKVPGTYPLHKVIATGGKPSSKKTSQGTMPNSKKK